MHDSSTIRVSTILKVVATFVVILGPLAALYLCLSGYVLNAYGTSFSESSDMVTSRIGYYGHALSYALYGLGLVSLSSSLALGALIFGTQSTQSDP